MPTFTVKRTVYEVITVEAHNEEAALEVAQLDEDWSVVSEDYEVTHGEV